MEAYGAVAPWVAEWLTEYRKTGEVPYPCPSSAEEAERHKAKLAEQARKWREYVEKKRKDRIVLDRSLECGRELRRIAAEVCQEHGITLAALTGRSRIKEIVAARHHYFYRARVETNKSLPQIGFVVGKFDHTSVLHGIQRHCQRHGLEYPRKGEAA